MAKHRFWSFKSSNTSGSPYYELQPVKSCNSSSLLSASPRMYIRWVRPHCKTPCQRNNCVASIMKFSEDKDILDKRGLIVDDPNFTLVQHSPRRVTFALHKDVEKQIMELEEKGIMKRAVEPAQWICSIIITFKPQKIRICLDPSCNIKTPNIKYQRRKDVCRISAKP